MLKDLILNLCTRLMWSIIYCFALKKDLSSMYARKLLQKKYVIFCISNGADMQVKMQRFL